MVQALSYAKVDPIYQFVYSSTIGLVFFAVPHRGVNLQEAEVVPGDGARTLTSEAVYSNIPDLEADSKALHSLGSQFRHHLPNYQILSFYETWPSNGSNLVSESS